LRDDFITPGATSVVCSSDCIIEEITKEGLKCLKYLPPVNELSPIELFVKYLVTEETEYEQEEIILITSKELFNRFEYFINKRNISYNTNAISFCIKLKNYHINGVTTGINTKTCKKTEFIKQNIKKYFGC
jgi:hypothetical protein